MDTREMDEVLAFWFGELTADGRPNDATFSTWWKQDDGFDSEIRARFGELHTRAAAGECDGWASSPLGAVALIVLLDQFSRNMFRDDPRAFDQDPAALAVSRGLVESKALLTLLPAHHYIALMPWMHSEDVAVQRRGIELFAAARDAAPNDAVRKIFAAAHEYQERHAVVIEKFGRFPHRNDVLGRTTTPEEARHLEEHGRF